MKVDINSSILIKNVFLFHYVFIFIVFWFVVFLNANRYQKSFTVGINALVK